MAKKNKKNKKNKGTKKPSVTKQQDAAVLLREQHEAFSVGRGRRASVLGERIYQDASVDELVRRRAFAAGHEAFLRELLSKGHAEQVRAKADKLLRSADWLADFWALSLKLRLGLTEYQDERSWLDRVRAELVDPSDLCEIESGGLGVQAQLVLEAWIKVETGDDSGALECLQRVGRRSPLVDWRLFVQVLVSVKQGNRTSADAAVKRMLEGCPAQAAAEKLLQSVDESVGYYTRRLKGLEETVEKGRLKAAAYPKLAGLVKYALAEGRPGFALTVASTFGVYIESQYEADRYFALFERMKMEGFSLTHLYVRMALIDSPHNGLLHPDLSQDIRGSGWSKPEAARLWIRFFEQAQKAWNEIRVEADAWELEEAAESLLVPLLTECRQLVQKLPDCREIYLFWDWAEKECGVGTHEGMTAFVEAFPEDADMLRLAVTRFAEVQAFETAEVWLTRLMRLLKSEAVVHDLRQVLLFHRIKAAYQAEDIGAVEKWAAEYSGQQLSERVQVAFMRWRKASKGDKRKRGVELAELNVPWLVLYYACESEDGFRIYALPAGVKRLLENDPDAILKGYLELLACDRKLALEPMSGELGHALGKALDHPGVSVALLRPALTALMMQMDDLYDLIADTQGFMQAFRTLLSGNSDDQALALALRIRAGFEVLGGQLDEGKVDRSLRVAWTLADYDETRRLISNVTSLCKAASRKQLKKPATEKMIQAELKMQHKFRDFDQVKKRYQGPWRVPVGGFDDPFDEMAMDEVESIIESWEDEFPSAKGSANYDAGSFEDTFEPDVLPESKSKPFVFSKGVPATEMEFEVMIGKIRFTTRGKHRNQAAETLGNLIQGAPLSDKAKARLLQQQNILFEGE